MYRLVGLNNKTTQAHYSEFHSFDNHQMYIYFIYFFLKPVTDFVVRLINIHTHTHIYIYIYIYIYTL